MPSSAQRRTSAPAGVGQAGAGVGRGGEGERDAVGERVRRGSRPARASAARRRTRASSASRPGSIASAPSWCMTRPASTPSSRAASRSAIVRTIRSVAVALEARAAARPPRSSWRGGDLGADRRRRARPPSGRPCAVEVDALGARRRREQGEDPAREAARAGAREVEVPPSRPVAKSAASSRVMRVVVAVEDGDHGRRASACVAVQRVEVRRRTSR